MDTVTLRSSSVERRIVLLVEANNEPRGAASSDRKEEY
jgi:hypothetical protein